MAKGKDTTYVVNFWATWCSPCVEELPNFEKLHQMKVDKPVKVLLLSLDFKSKLSTVLQFVKKHKINSEVFVVDEKDQQAFIERVDKNWSGALPATLFVNTARNWNAFFEKALSFKELIDIVELKK